MKFSSILKKINFKSRKSMLKTGAILFWTDMKRLFNWNMDNFKSNFLSRGQLGSKSNDNFFLSVLQMWQCCKYFFGNLIFALTARTLSGNRLKLLKKPHFQKRRWSYDFPPRKTRVAQKHRVISRQEKMAFSTPVGLSWDSPPPPRVCADGRTYGCTDVRMYGRTDGRSRDYHFTTKISRIDRVPNFLNNGAPLAGFDRRLR